MAIETHTRESVPFRVRTADGDTVELTYSSPRQAATHDERSVLDTLPWFESGELKPVIDRVYPLEQAGAAHQRLMDRAQFGKLILTVAA